MCTFWQLVDLFFSVDVPRNKYTEVYTLEEKTTQDNCVLAKGGGYGGKKNNMENDNDKALTYTGIREKTKTNLKLLAHAPINKKSVFNLGRKFLGATRRGAVALVASEGEIARPTCWRGGTDGDLIREKARHEVRLLLYEKSAGCQGKRNGAERRTVGVLGVRLKL